MSKLDDWKALATGDIELPNGPTVTIHLPNLRDCIISGDVPLPILQKMEEAGKAKNGKSPDMTTDELRHVVAFEKEVVRRSVIAIGGEELTLTLEDVETLPEEHRAEIYSYAVREKPLPGKAG